MPQTNQNPATDGAHISASLGVSYEVGFGKKNEIYGVVQATGTVQTDGASGQITANTPELASVYGLAFSIGLSWAFGNSRYASGLSGVSDVKSLTLGFIQVTYSRSGPVW